MNRTDGRVYETGDTRQQFSIQSISKPFLYGIALEDCGREEVLAKKLLGAEHGEAEKRPEDVTCSPNCPDS